MKSVQLPDMDKPASDATAHRLTYSDGLSRVVYTTENELPYPDGKLIVSRVDLDGIITHANDAFVDISGYSRDELIGAPHHILRHPQMPKAAFKDLWQTVEAGKKWHGYVKNLCKDGSYYLGVCDGCAQYPPWRNGWLYLGTTQTITQQNRAS